MRGLGLEHVREDGRRDHQVERVIGVREAVLVGAMRAARVVARTAAVIMRSSLTSSPPSVSIGLPRDITMTSSHSPSSSLASDEFTITGMPEPLTSRRIR